MKTKLGEKYTPVDIQTVGQYRDRRSMANACSMIPPKDLNPSNRTNAWNAESACWCMQKIADKSVTSVSI